MHYNPPYAGIRDTDFGVNLNPGNKNVGPFAIIDIGDGCRVQLTGSREDMRRLLRAAGTALAMFSTLGRPHPFKPGPDESHCKDCGMHREWNDHAEPEQAATAERGTHPYPAIESRPWACQGCGAPMIGAPATYCGECASLKKEGYPVPRELPQPPAGAEPPPCPQTDCTGVARHPMPHRDADGVEWDDNSTRAHWCADHGGSAPGSACAKCAPAPAQHSHRRDADGTRTTCPVAECNFNLSLDGEADPAGKDGAS